MDAMNERYDKGWKLLEAKIGEDYAKRDAEFSKLWEDNAQFREDISKRDTANTRWLIAVITASTAIIIGVVLSTS